MYPLSFAKVLLFLAITSNSLGQKLEKTFIRDSVISKELRSFLIHCYKENVTYGEKGVVHMTLHPDTSINYQWISLYQRLDDNFKFLPPPHSYAHFMEKIILVYDENKPLYEWTEEQKNFLLDEIGNRINVTQTRLSGWIETYNPDGSLKARYQKATMMKGGGSPFDTLLRIDKKTGKVTHFKTV